MDIEKYIDGTLTEIERREMEAAMATDPALRAEVETRRRLQMGLQELYLQNKVQQVAHARHNWLRQQWWLRVGGMIFLVILLSIVVFFIWEKPTTAVPERKPATPELQNESLPKTQPNQLEEKKIPARPKKNKSTQPIAEGTPIEDLPSPLYPSPNVRGENSENKAWKTLIDKIWHTTYPLDSLTISEPFEAINQLLTARDFNQAYVRLQRLERNVPDNDTLRFIKGYCLLEMGEGAEALTYFEKLEERQPTWTPQLQWYRGLSLLLIGNKEKALSQFREIAAQPQHKYRLQSEQAIRILK